MGFGHLTSNMRHLFVVGEFVVVSHLKIFPLELLGLATTLSGGKIALHYTRDE